MKDYTIFSKNNDNIKNFILNYEIENQEIFIKFASGDKIKIPYTLENEEKIINKMINQTELIPVAKKKIKKEKIFYTLFIVLLIFCLISLNFIAISEGDFIYLSNVRLFNIISVPMSILDLLTLNYYRNYEKDIIKVKTFLENQEKLNENIRKNTNMLYKVSNKTKEVIDKVAVEDSVFTINSIDKMSLKDLKRILINIKREQEFEFDYQSDEEVSSFVRKKSRSGEDN